MEIGGYFGFENYKGNIYHEKALKFNSARNCLRFLIRKKHINRLFIPYYLCGGIMDICEEENCEIVYYHIDDEFRIQESFEIEFNIDKDYLYVVNFCGFLEDSYVKKLREKYKNIILDNVQNFFGKPMDEIDVLYSCRKFFGVADGGLLYTDVKDISGFERDQSGTFMRYLIGRYEHSAEKFYLDYRMHEEYLDRQPIRVMSKLTENILRSMDYQYIEEQRNKNFAYLHERIKSLNGLKVNEKITGAFSYPLLISDGKKIRKRLIEKKIFIPQYWKEVKKIPGVSEVEKGFVDNILWLPCDHRYSLIDMEYMLRVLEQIIEREV